MAADAAVQGIRQVDADGSIGVISAESQPPYNRPPLSKALWKGKRLETIWRNAAIREAALHLGCRVESLDRENRRVVDDHGTTYRYEKLLLATGGTPRQLPGDPTAIIYFRTLGDYQHLRLLAGQKRRFAVIGGGFIGSEIAAALAMNGKDVVMVFPDQGVGARMFPPELARFLNDFYREKGVEVRAGEEVVGIEARQGGFVVKTRDAQTKREQEITAEAVVAGLGIRPNVELAKGAGLTVGNGIRVDAALRTSDPHVFAAGDAAEFFNPALATYLRVEH